MFVGRYESRCHHGGVVSDRFVCPHCEVVASPRHNFIRHLTSTHGLGLDDAQQWANDRIQPGERTSRPSGPVFVTPGHLRSVSMLEDTDTAAETISSFREALGGVEILLRPVDAGLTVMSLDVERCGSMISVGARGGGGALTSLPPSSDRTASMVSAYEGKREDLARESLEELFSLRLVAAALANELRLPAAPWLFVAHEWRVHLSNESNGKIDLLGFDPSTRRLVVIELKASAADARKLDQNGWDAARQADEYASAIWEGRNELYPFFDRLIAAQAALYVPEDQVASIDSSSRPTTTVWWPDAEGDHTPVWPAWNSIELLVKRGTPRLAKYRRHQSWWRESQRGVTPGDHPKVPGRLIGSMFAAASVEADRRLNFIDEAAYRHAERRAHEVDGEGGTLDAERLFGNLLSSMPMCFNLFGAIGTAPRFADLVRSVFDDEAADIGDVVCEAPSPPTWSDRTAFDAQINYTTRGGDRRFLAIETKYTEPFTQIRYDRPEYRHLTERSGWFEQGASNVLVDVETNQLWRGLLLMNVVESHIGANGRYCVVAPADDSDARAAVGTVRSWLVPDERWRLCFVSLEEIVAAARGITDHGLNNWADDFSQRYLPS